MLGSKVRLDLLWANRLLLAEMLVFGVGMHVQDIVQVGPSRVLHERFEPPSASKRRVEALASQQTQQQSRDFVAQPRCISTQVPRIMVDVALVEKGSNTVNTDSTWWRFVMENVSGQNRLKHRILNHPTNH